MKNLYNAMKSSILLLALILSASAVNGQINAPRGSQHATVTQRVGTSDITINYSRPSVKGREIWGKLVPYGMTNLGFGTATASPWRAGADENTTITFSHDAKVEGKDIKAGTYGLHIEVKEGDKATIILSHDINSWGVWPNAARSARSMHMYLFQEHLRYDLMAQGLGAAGDYVNNVEDFRASLARAYKRARDEKVSTLINCQAIKEFTSPRDYPPGISLNAEPGVGAVAH